METDYRACVDLPFTHRVGQVNNGLIAAHISNRVESSEFLSDCNPFSRAVNEVESSQLQHQLAKELTKLGLTFFQ